LLKIDQTILETRAACEEQQDFSTKCQQQVSRRSKLNVISTTGHQRSIEVINQNPSIFQQGGGTGGRGTESGFRQCQLPVVGIQQLLSIEKFSSPLVKMGDDELQWGACRHRKLA
tara:strand:+ start:1836 stop:2180 length:345 start_codon:yes stop_codon:yes gene_type:complete